jgi:hypothetical protein
MITGITAMQGRRMGVAHAVLFRAFDFHAPPPIALEAMQFAEGNASAQTARTPWVRALHSAAPACRVIPPLVPSSSR